MLDDRMRQWREAVEGATKEYMATRLTVLLSVILLVSLFGVRVIVGFFASPQEAWFAAMLTGVALVATIAMRIQGLLALMLANSTVEQVRRASREQ